MFGSEERILKAKVTRYPNESEVWEIPFPGGEFVIVRYHMGTPKVTYKIYHEGDDGLRSWYIDPSWDDIDIGEWMIEPAAKHYPAAPLRLVITKAV